MYKELFPVITQYEAPTFIMIETVHYTCVNWSRMAFVVQRLWLFD
eukprot:UN10706